MIDKTRQDWLESSNSGERMSDLQLDDVKTDENSAMVLLVDDQAMIGEAVRRGLALEQNIDFHFCSDPHQAIAQAIRISRR